MITRFLFVFSIVLVFVGCRIQKGFEALDEYNYFEAKKCFEKAIKRTPSPAAFGLSRIYGRNDNPFSDLDSAYHYALIAVEKFNTLKVKKRDKYRKAYGFSLPRVKLWREEISGRFFQIAVEENTLIAYMTFYSKHPWSPLRDSALYLRDLLAFEQAMDENTAKGFAYFLKHFGEGPFVEEIEVELQLAQYRETVKDGDIGSFERFIEIFPANFLVSRANRKIYEMATELGTEVAYREFIQRYPENPYINEAWLNLYRVATTEYTIDAIERFIKVYPNFPFTDYIDADLELVDKLLLPFRSNDKFGFMNEKGVPEVPAMYDYAGLFNNGVAPVLKNERFGFVDKNNDLVIPFKYEDALDFDQGRCIVENEGRLGLIDRTGKYILPTEYEEIGPMSNGLFYAAKDGKYGYFDKFGHNRIPLKYDEAFSFQRGLAIVIDGNATRLIDLDGIAVFSLKDVEMRSFSDSLFVVEARDSVYLITIDGQVVLDQAVDRIGSLSENRAIIEVGDRYGYIDSRGQVIIPPTLPKFSNYFQFAQFKNGHAKFMRAGKFGSINLQGAQVMTPLFSDIGEFGELIPICKGDKWGYSDAAVKLKIQYRFDYAFPFVDGRAKVVMSNQYGVIDLTGTLIVPTEYDAITPAHDGLFVVEFDNKLGLIDRTGNIIVDVQYRRIVPVNDQFLQMESNEGLDYYDLRHHRLVSLEKENE